MLHLIAQSAPETIKPWLENFFWLIGSIGALLGVAIGWKTLFGAKEKLSLEQQPLEVKKHAGTVSEAELNQVHGRIARERLEIEAKIAKLEAEDRRLAEKLDEKITDLEERIDKVPERTINLLRNTKGLLE